MPDKLSSQRCFLFKQNHLYLRQGMPCLYFIFFFKNSFYRFFFIILTLIILTNLFSSLFNDFVNFFFAAAIPIALPIGDDLGCKIRPIFALSLRAHIAPLCENKQRKFDRIISDTIIKKDKAESLKTGNKKFVVFFNSWFKKQIDCQNN